MSTGKNQVDIKIKLDLKIQDLKLEYVYKTDQRNKVDIHWLRALISFMAKKNSFAA